MVGNAAELTTMLAPEPLTGKTYYLVPIYGPDNTAILTPDMFTYGYYTLRSGNYGGWSSVHLRLWDWLVVGSSYAGFRCCRKL